MHVVPRPHLPPAPAIAAVCAALAIGLTLLLAGPLNDLASTSAGGSPIAAPTPVRSAATGAGWNLSPLTSLLRAPVPIPWTAGF